MEPKKGDSFFQGFCNWPSRTAQGGDRGWGVSISVKRDLVYKFMPLHALTQWVGGFGGLVENLIFLEPCVLMFILFAILVFYFHVILCF